MTQDFLTSALAVSLSQANTGFLLGRMRGRIQKKPAMIVRFFRILAGFFLGLPYFWPPWYKRHILKYGVKYLPNKQINAPLDKDMVSAFG